MYWIILIKFSTICSSFLCVSKEKTSTFTWLKQTTRLRTLFSFANSFFRRLGNLLSWDVRYPTHFKDIFLLKDMCHISLLWSVRHVWRRAHAIASLICRSLLLSGLVKCLLTRWSQVITFVQLKDQMVENLIKIIQFMTIFSQVTSLPLFSFIWCTLVVKQDY